MFNISKFADCLACYFIAINLVIKVELLTVVCFITSCNCSDVSCVQTSMHWTQENSYHTLHDMAPPSDRLWNLCLQVAVKVSRFTRTSSVFPNILSLAITWTLKKPELRFLFM